MSLLDQQYTDPGARREVFGANPDLHVTGECRFGVVVLFPHAPEVIVGLVCALTQCNRLLQILIGGLTITHFAVDQRQCEQQVTILRRLCRENLKLFPRRRQIRSRQHTGILQAQLLGVGLVLEHFLQSRVGLVVVLLCQNFGFQQHSLRLVRFQLQQCIEFSQCPVELAVLRVNECLG